MFRPPRKLLGGKMLLFGGVSWPFAPQAHPGILIPRAPRRYEGLLCDLFGRFRVSQPRQGEPVEDIPFQWAGSTKLLDCCGFTFAQDCKELDICSIVPARPGWFFAKRGHTVLPNRDHWVTSPTFLRGCC